jgi:hypothetical protein
MVQKIKISKITQNTNNPRVIKDNKFKKLVKSIQEFPEMLRVRPIVVDEKNVVLGGNMRLRACKEAGLNEVWIEKIENFTEEQKREFIVKDNVGFGEWEWDMLANQWDNTLLNEWGLDVWNGDEVNIDDIYQEHQEENKELLNKIILEFNEEEYNLVKQRIEKDGRSASVIFKTALDL